VPPVSVRVKTAGPWPLPAHRQRARMPPGYWIVALRGSAAADPPLRLRRPVV
jgi:hypothetical protein